MDNALNHRFETLHIVYDGINGQLPNLDLFNTATSIASGQMGIGVALQSMWSHSDSYKDRLRTMLRGMASQGLGHASGPHSSFIPYHVDAITLQAVGDGWQDEMAMGRCVESTFRSLNNLLEKFHQSFFFYLLMQPTRFVSIGTYLPSAMVVAVNFTITAIALWVRSGRPPAIKAGSTITKGEKEPEMEVIKSGGMVAITPKQNLMIIERQLFLPIALVVSSHFLGVIPLYIFNNATGDVRFAPPLITPLPLTTSQTLPSILSTFALANLALPTLLASLLALQSPPTPQQRLLLQCFSLLLLGMFLATLATLNFSLAFLIGLLASPLSFVGPPFSTTPSPNEAPSSRARKVVLSGLLQLLSPPVVVLAMCRLWGVDVGRVLVEAAFGWRVQGLWTQVVVWCVWWPAWLVGGVVCSPLL